MKYRLSREDKQGCGCLFAGFYLQFWFPLGIGLCVALLSDRFRDDVPIIALALLFWLLVSLFFQFVLGRIDNA